MPRKKQLEPLHKLIERLVIFCHEWKHMQSYDRLRMHGFVEQVITIEHSSLYVLKGELRR